MTKMEDLEISIVGLGLWVPDKVVTNDAWPKEFVERAKSGDRSLNDIERSSDEQSAAILERHLKAEANDPFLGAVERRYAEPQETAAYASGQAGLNALVDALSNHSGAPMSVPLIDHVLTYDVVPDRVGMQTGAAVLKTIRDYTAQNVMYSVLDNTCASVSTQLAHAVGLLATHQAHAVLCTQSSVWTRTFMMTHPASPGVGDAASAFIVARSSRGLRACSNYGVGHPEHLDSVAWVRGMSGPNDPHDVPWYLAGGDFHMGSKRPAGVKELTRDTVIFGAKTVSRAAHDARIGDDEIAALCSVQPRGFIPDAIAERLNLCADSAPSTYERYGHIGASGVIANLIEARAQGLIKHGDHVALYGQGFGFTRTASILRSYE